VIAVWSCVGVPRFPFDKIKIDQSFVNNIEERDAREIVRAIANLGQTLGMTTTAEDVETETQLEKMIAYRCVEVQGYFFSQPVPRKRSHACSRLSKKRDRSPSVISGAPA
jgi:EAL domain-containing protein (putative c-di-GMP-specific phosphodiesterase class I)